MVARPTQWIVVCSVLALTGCVKRTEKITVLEDGRVRLAVEIEGDLKDVQSGDAMPVAAGGWAIDDRRETDDDGRETLVRKATRTVEGTAIPASYAVPGTRDEKSALRFPTTVTVEQRRDGTYYHFKRVYERRDNGANQYRERIMKADAVQQVTEKDPDTLTLEDQRVVAEALIAAHAATQLRFVDAGMAACAHDIPQDALLRARAAAGAVFDGVIEQVMPIIREKDESDDAEQLDVLEQRLATTMREAVRTALTDAGVLAHHIGAFFDALDLAADRHRVTSDLDDEEWRVVVRLPGEIVAHNGIESPDWSSEGPDMASFNGFWEFKGQDLYDGDVVLMATSRVVAPESSKPAAGQ